jgi:hypothetical protein
MGQGGARVGKACAIALALASLCAGQVRLTVSRQPLEAFEAAFGGRLSKVALYSVQVCNSGPGQIQVSGGRIRQAVESSGVNVIDYALSQATASRAVSRTKTAKTVVFLKWMMTGASFGAAPVAALKDTRLSTDVTAISAGLAAILQLVEVPLTASERANEQAAAAAVGRILDPASVIVIGGSSCVAPRLVYGEYLAGFRPVTVGLE